jgi:hypothetical protein
MKTKQRVAGRRTRPLDDRDQPIFLTTREWFRIWDVVNGFDTLISSLACFLKHAQLQLPALRAEQARQWEMLWNTLQKREQ